MPHQIKPKDTIKSAKNLHISRPWKSVTVEIDPRLTYAGLTLFKSKQFLIPLNPRFICLTKVKRRIWQL